MRKIIDKALILILPGMAIILCIFIFWVMIHLPVM